MTNTTNNQSLIDIQSLLDAGAAHCEAQHVGGCDPYAVVPKNYKLEYLRPETDVPLPDYIKQTVQIAELDSFARYVKRYQSVTTQIFGVLTEQDATFTAIFDYHRASKDGATATPANRTAHRAIYRCPASHAWKQWRNNNTRAMKQEEFAKFIDDNAPDIIEPDSATLMELLLNFESKTDVQFATKLVRQSGARVLEYTETIDATGTTSSGKMKVPETFKLGFPIFQGGKSFVLDAKLYFRAGGGKLAISYELRRPHEVVESAIRDMITDIMTATGIEPVIGEVQ